MEGRETPGAILSLGSSDLGWKPVRELLPFGQVNGGAHHTAQFKSCSQLQDLNSGLTSTVCVSMYS